MSGSGTAERGSAGTDFSHLRPCLNGGLAGGGLAGVIQQVHTSSIRLHFLKENFTPGQQGITQGITQGQQRTCVIWVDGILYTT